MIHCDRCQKPIPTPSPPGVMIGLYEHMDDMGNKRIMHICPGCYRDWNRHCVQFFAKSGPPPEKPDEQPKNGKGPKVLRMPKRNAPA